MASGFEMVPKSLQQEQSMISFVTFTREGEHFTEVLADIHSIGFEKSY
jgi:hypothetical protein